MVRTEIVNFTSATVQVKEGNKRVMIYTHTPNVEPNQVHKVSVDPNATYKMFTIGPVTGGPQVEISSDYCSDNQIVYVRTSKTGDILFKDPVPRTAIMVEKTIVNKAAQTIVLREEVQIAEGVGSSEIAKVIKGEKGKWRVDPEADHRRYFVESEKPDESGITPDEIPKEKFRDKKKFVVTLADVPEHPGQKKLVIT